jgi:hypothetical protein
MTHDDVLRRFQVRRFGLAEELGNVRATCWTLGVHHSTHYRWCRPVLRFTALRTDLARDPCYCNHDRAHTGRRTQGRTPAEVLGAAEMWLQRPAR